MSPKVFFPPFFSSPPSSSPSPADLRFFISPHNLRVLYSPHHFFDVLAFLLRTARNRVVLSSLYFGSGSSEAKLFELLRRNAERNGQNFKIDILMDFMRGTRENHSRNHSPSSSSSSVFHEGTEDEGKMPQPSGWRWRLRVPWQGGRLSPPFSQSSSCWIPRRFPWPPPRSSSAALVAPLLDLPSSVSVSLFYHPFVSQIAQALLPARMQEVLGVMHMKIYLADDTLIMTGANLSKSYLTNRQDRYIIIRDPRLADCIHSIVKEVQKMSFALIDSKMTLRWGRGEMGKLERERKKKEKEGKEEENVSNPINDRIGFRKQFGLKMKKLLEDLRQKTVRDEEDERWKSTASNFVEFPKRSSIASYSSSFHSSSSASSSSSPSFPFSSSSLPSSFSCYVGVFLQAGFALPPLTYETSMLHRLLNQVVLQSYRVVIISGYLNLTFEFLSRLSALVQKSFNDSYHQNCRLGEGLQKKEKKKDGGDQRMKKKKIVFHSSPVCLISAAPEANSFFKSKGISRFIPAAYACVAERCLKYLLENWRRTSRTDDESSTSWSSSHQEEEEEEGEGGGRYQQKRRRREKERRKEEKGFPLILWEYQRKHWTFHSKGIWVYPPHKSSSSSSNVLLPLSSAKSTTNSGTNLAGTHSSSGRRRKKMKEKSIVYNVDKEGGGEKKEKANLDFPFATIVGSSNFGYRSAERDLELSMLIYTQNKRVKEELQMEMMKTKEKCKAIENTRKLKERQPWWMQFMIEKGGGKYFL